MKAANEPLASSPQSLRAGNLPPWKVNLHQRERWRFRDSIDLAVEMMRRIDSRWPSSKR